MPARQATSFAPFLSGAQGSEPDLLSVLLTLIGHDLRTPLNAVIGFSDCMERQLFGPLGDARYEAYARHIRESGARLLKAAEQTLALAAFGVKQGNTQTRRLPLRRLFQEARDELGSDAAGEPAHLAVDIGSDVEVEHNEDVIRLALYYVLKGIALPGGHVSIRAEVEFGTVLLACEGDCAGASEGPLDSYLTLARVLLEAQGGSLGMQRRAGGWRVTVGLADAAQPELALF